MDKRYFGTACSLRHVNVWHVLHLLVIHFHVRRDTRHYGGCTLTELLCLLQTNCFKNLWEAVVQCLLPDNRQLWVVVVVFFVINCDGIGTNVAKEWTGGRDWLLWVNFFPLKDSLFFLWQNIFLFPFPLPSAVSLQGPYAKRLYRNLMSDYNPMVRPVVNDSDNISVQFSVTLRQIIDVVCEPSSPFYWVTELCKPESFYTHIHTAFFPFGLNIPNHSWASLLKGHFIRCTLWEAGCL